MLIKLWLMLFICQLQFLQASAYGQQNNSDPRILGFVLPDGYKRLSIPFELHNNLIVLEVLLNNTLPLKFILDTGVRTSVLTEKTFTDLLNITYSRKIDISGAGGENMVTAYVANNVTIAIGQIIGHGHALLVLEHDLLQLKNYLGIDVHGILGYELFTRFVIDINYDRKIVTFHDPKHYSKRSSFHEIPIVIEDTKPYLKAECNILEGLSYNGKFMIDTGASHSLLIEEDSDSSLFIPEPSLQSHLGRGIAGDIYGEIARIDGMSFDDFSFNGVITTFPTNESYGVNLEHVYRNGTIGGGILSRFRVVFDYGNSKMYIKKSSNYKRPFEYGLSGLLIKAEGPMLDQYRVKEVRINSSAEKAGVMAGDKILIINGHYADEIHLDELVGLLNSKHNKMIKITLQRDNNKIIKRFRLQRLI